MAAGSGDQEVVDLRTDRELLLAFGQSLARVEGAVDRLENALEEFRPVIESYTKGPGAQALQWGARRRAARANGAS